MAEPLCPHCGNADFSVSRPVVLTRVFEVEAVSEDGHVTETGIQVHEMERDPAEDLDLDPADLVDGGLVRCVECLADFDRVPLASD